MTATPPPIAPGSGSPDGAAHKKPWLRWVLIGCGGALVVLVVFVVGVFMVVKQATAEPEKVVATFLEEAAAGNLEAAHDCFSAPLKDAQPFDQFADTVRANRQFFDVVETSFSERSVDLAGAKLAGTVTLTTGTKVPCSFQLVRENDDWKLLAYNIGAGSG